MQKVVSLLFLICLSLIKVGLSQIQSDTLYHFKFIAAEKAEINRLSRIISIDNVMLDTVFAYANPKEFSLFQNFNIAYEFIAESKSNQAVSMATSLLEMSNWDKYPSYELYEEMMLQWACQYPDICILEEIGTL